MSRPTFPPEHYASRFGKVLAYIDAQLIAQLPLATLAGQAAFSPYYFHRIFCDWQGETPQSYIRRRRLERGAALLRYGPDVQVREIAPECGFASVEAFNRAFRGYFGMTPGHWRRGGYLEWQLGADPPPLTPAPTNDQVQLLRMPAVQAIYARKVGPYHEGDAALWERLRALVAPFGLEGGVCFGVGLDDPAVTPAAHCRFDACVTLPRGVAVPAYLPVKQLSSTHCAVLAYDGPAGAADSHWRWLLQSWLPASRYRISQHACFERYRHGIPTADQTGSELCLPLVR